MLDFSGSIETSKLLIEGLSLFYDQLLKNLETNQISTSADDLLANAAHGKEHLRLGYSLSHVVHSYGSICQAITELASLKNAKITSSEFSSLNACLDVAIAAAVSEYHFQSHQFKEEREVKHLGFLAHELRSALSRASIAHDMIKAGLVGTSGSTSRVLEMNLLRMRDLIDRSLSEVRMRSDADLFIEKFHLFDLLDQIIITSKTEASKKQQVLKVQIDHNIELEGDRQILISVFANLIQNAIKYSKSNGKIWIRAKSSEKIAHIQIEDECGGLEPEKIDSLFDAYVQENKDRSGIGLGLAIVQKAVHLSQGKISVHNNPPRGCKFVVEIPLKITPEPSKKISVSGEHSMQPNFKKE
jgi:signal transduction histidine kinase